MTRYIIEYSLLDVEDYDGVSGSCYEVGYMSGFSFIFFNEMGYDEEILLRTLQGDCIYMGL